MTPLDADRLHPIAAGVDIGGTFTDIVLAREDCRLEIVKVLSSPPDYGVAIRRGLTAALAGAGVKGEDVGRIAHGTTVASNAVLEGSCAAPALVTTRGCRDVIEIGRLRLPKLYDVAWTKPAPLVPRELRFEVTERMAADGTVVEALDEASDAAAVEAVRASGVRSVAVSLLNAYANPAHEELLREAFHRQAPDIDVTVGTEISRQIREVERTSTVIVNAYLRPIIRGYLGGLRDKLDEVGIGGPLFISQSTGGLTSAGHALKQPVTLLESGPAAGVVAAAALARRLGVDKMISFDMGGTTANAASIEEGAFLRTSDFAVGGGIISGSRLLTGAGHPLQVPAIDLAEVGAGGGSIVRVDGGGALAVGPESAGSSPGPVCYGLGGARPTITDAAAVLGYLNPAGIAGGTVPIDVAAARHAFARRIANPLGIGVEDAAFAAIQIAGSTMLRALRAVSSERGRDPREYVLAAFGGNGPLFGPFLAQQLGACRVVVPPHPGLFSAVGLLLADVEHERSEAVLRPLDAVSPDVLTRRIADLARAIVADLAEEGFSAAAQRIETRLSLRFLGQTHALSVRVAGNGLDARALVAAAAAFADEHERTYGHRAGSDEAIEIVAVSVSGHGVFARPARRSHGGFGSRAASGRQAFFGPSAGWRDVAVLGRGDLAVERDGPCIVEEYDSTVLVPPGCSAFLHGDGVIDIRLGSP